MSLRLAPDIAELGLITDLYQLTMLQAYWAEGMDRTATFSLFFRELPPNRNFMLACGQRHVAELIARIRFPDNALKRLAEVGLFRDDFLQWLADFRFSGDLHAMPEGTLVFPHEPMLEVEAPIYEAQLLETLVMNYVHLETLLASKAARMVLAADGRPVVDFGMRRMHGLDSAWRGVRAYRTAGIAGTSHVLAGLEFDLPLKGTMAHSFIQAHGHESGAFRRYAELYPGTTILVDTYDTLAAVRELVRLKHELGDSFRIDAIRLDSGDLAALAKTARAELDRGGLQDVRILASGGLDEWKIRDLLHAGAPIDGFGVGTKLGSSEDAPVLDLVYKLTEYAGEPRLKNSPGKELYPGRKQVWRETGSDGRLRCDRLTLRDRKAPGTPLLEPIMRGGQLLDAVHDDPDAGRARAARELAALPGELQGPDRAASAYPVHFDDSVTGLRAAALDKLGLDGQ